MGVRLREHKYNSKEGHCSKSDLVFYVFEEGHKNHWTQACILQFEYL
jgi:hypothetical protein